METTTTDIITTMEKRTNPFNTTRFIGRNPAESDITKTDWTQHWKRMGRNSVCDQYAFQIDHDQAAHKPFTLYFKGAMVCQVYREQTAKLISCILLNDILLFTHKEEKQEAGND